MRPDPEAITACIQSQSEPEPFSGVVYLTRGEEVLYERAFGLAVRAESIPNRVNTRFQMASGCKIFTGVAICQLVEHGRLDFHTLLSECVNQEFPKYDPDISVHHLLTHASGITSYFEEDVNPDYEALWQDLPMYRVKRPMDFLPLFQNKPMKFKPGERFDYNDGGFILLGLVIEAISGMEFTEYVRKHIFEPSGMADSGYFPTDQLPPRTAYAYIKKQDGTWRTNFFAVPIVGGSDGGAYTTALDMAKFWRALTGNRLLKPETTEMLLQPKIETSWDWPYTHYGYGVWITCSERDGQRPFVVGSDPGVAMKSTLYGDGNLVLTALGNTGKALWPLYEELEKILGVYGG